MTGPHDGGCYCGRVRYRIHRPVGRPCICHCRSCQRASGGVAMGWCFVAPVDFEVQSGEISEVAGPDGVRRGFCAGCGTSLTYRSPAVSSGRLDVSLASLDDPAQLPPTEHIQTADVHPGMDPGQPLPRYPGWRPEEP